MKRFVMAVAVLLYAATVVAGVTHTDFAAPAAPPPLPAATPAPVDAVAGALQASTPEATGGGPSTGAKATTAVEPPIVDLFPPDLELDEDGDPVIPWPPRQPAPPPPPAPPRQRGEPPPHTPTPTITSPSYLVMEASSGKVLEEQNPHERRSPASLTKIMTALVVLERAKLEDVVTVPEEVKALRASTLVGVEPGERLTVHQMLQGLLLPSGNDAAVALAVHVSGTEQAFVDLMNRKARDLGMMDTLFTNSHGLDTGPWGTPYSSAYDFAVLTRAAIQNPVFRGIVSQKTYSFKGEQNGYGGYNGNLLLWTYPGADGVKIGWTNRAGQTLAATATRDGRQLIAVVLASGNRDRDAAQLLDRAFQMPPQ